MSEPSPTITLTTRSTRSVPTHVLQSLIKPFKPALASPGKLPKYKTGESPRLTPQEKYSCRIEERTIGGLFVYDIFPPGSASTTPADPGKKRKRIYYFAGGGFVAPPSKEHWCFACEIARRLGRRAVVSVVSPPLAPATTAELGLGMLKEWYRTVLVEAETAGDDVVLMGDSSGGNLALCCALFDVGEGAITKAVVVVSPSLDLEKGNPEMKKAEQVDPVQTMKSSKDGTDQWSGNIGKKDPRISPLYADLSVLARRSIDVHCVSGSHDVLHPDTKLMRQKLNAAGVRGEWLEWEKQMHCFPLAWTYGLPEAKAGKDWIVDLLQKS